jgi:hypothetical protein
MQLGPDEAAATVERHPCPQCEVPAGSTCRTRAGKTATKYHTARFILVSSLRDEFTVPVPADRGPGIEWCGSGWLPGGSGTGRLMGRDRRPAGVLVAHGGSGTWGVACLGEWSWSIAPPGLSWVEGGGPARCVHPISGAAAIHRHCEIEEGSGGAHMTFPVADTPRKRMITYMSRTDRDEFPPVLWAVGTHQQGGDPVL